MIGHEVTGEMRAKMVDWMLAVFKAIKKSSPQTMFLAVAIMDKDFRVKKQEKDAVNKEQLHLIGLTAIFMSSKMEDIQPIYLN